jgi:hypothetical protein
MVAMIAGVPYPEARRVLFGTRRRRYFYTGYSDIRRGLDHYRIKHGRRERLFKSWASVGGPAVVCVRNPDGSLHWVLFNRSGGESYVLDPDPPQGVTLSRADFSHLKGVSYLLLDPGIFCRQSRFSQPDNDARRLRRAARDAADCRQRPSDPAFEGVYRG